MNEDVCVKEFHQAFDLPVVEKPTMPPMDQRILRVKLLAEELCELAEAFGVRLDIKSYLTVAGGSLACSRSHSIEVTDDWSYGYPDLVEAADAFTDIKYLADGGNVICGFPATELMAEVHRSNMSKLGPDSKPIYREDGKVLKGPNYSPPDIAGVLKKHS